MVAIRCFVKTKNIPPPQHYFRRWTSQVLREIGRRPHFPIYSRANTQTAPPSGTSGYWPGKRRFSVACIPRESPPQPECTAMYCFPSTRKEVGGARMPDVVGYSHS